MPKIFICYRQEDSEHVTAHIHTHMVIHFGKDNVFRDIENLLAGDDWREALINQVQEHDVMLVIIGPEWERIMQERANQLSDFARIEIESALKLKKRVVPVLVKGAKLPNFANLPRSIQDLQYRQAVPIRRFVKEDCERLADSIKGVITTQQIKSDGKLRILAVLPNWVDATREIAEEIQYRSDISTKEKQFKLVIPIAKDEFVYDLDAPLVVGRSDESTEKIPEIDFAEYDKKYGISRSHAKFDYKQGDVFITDLGSANGTYVDEDLLNFGVPHKLRNRDIIHFGALGTQIYVGKQTRKPKKEPVKKPGRTTGHRHKAKGEWVWYST